MFKTYNVGKLDQAWKSEVTGTFLIYKNERALRRVTLGAVVNCDWLIIVSELSAKFPNVAPHDRRLF